MKMNEVVCIRCVTHSSVGIERAPEVLELSVILDQLLLIPGQVRLLKYL